MVEKVKGISRVKEVQYNVNLQTEERRNGGSGQSFQDSLQQAMQQKRRAAALSSGMTVTEPYALDVSRATQSLFYASPSLLDELDVFSRISWAGFIWVMPMPMIVGFHGHRLFGILK